MHFVFLVTDSVWFGFSSKMINQLHVESLYLWTIQLIYVSLDHSLAKCITVELKSAELLCPQMDKCSLLDGSIKISITEWDFYWM